MNKAYDLLKISQATEQLDCIINDAKKYNEENAKRISELNDIISQAIDDYLTDKFPYKFGCRYSYIVDKKGKGMTERIGVLTSRKISRDGNFVLLTFKEWTNVATPGTFDVICNFDGTLVEWMENAERMLVSKPVSTFE